MNMKKILIVEDEIAYQKLLQDQLLAEGYDVIGANDGKSGLDIAKQEKPDLILLDIRMPVMDGVTMLLSLRKDVYGKSAKVILLSNLEPTEDMMKKIARAKPVHYLVKSDIELLDLLEKVKKQVWQKQ